MGKEGNGDVSRRRGDGEGSSSCNPGMQAHSLSYTLPSLKTALRKLQLPEDGYVRIADMGCSVGGVTLSYADFIVTTLRETFLSKSLAVPEFQYFFSDLATNDFNALFQQLHSLCRDGHGEPEDGDTRPYFAAGVPGSFYNRIFPIGHLHIVICTWSLHWISHIPDCVKDCSSAAYNRGRVWIDHGSPVVADAFSRVSREDMDNFFKHRATEMACGGLLFVNSMIRADSEHPALQFNDQYHLHQPYGEVFESTWEELVTEGLISAEKRDSINIPIFLPSIEEIQEAAARTSAFDIKEIKIWKDYQPAPEIQEQKYLADPEAYGQLGKGFAKGMFNSSVEAHIGPELACRLFDRLAFNLTAKFKETKKLFIHESITIAVVVLVRKEA